MEYSPQPLDTRGIELDPELHQLLEALAKNAHEHWAQQRRRDGWVYGPVRDDALKQHPCLVPYEELPEEEKTYDRLTVTETLKAIAALGYAIVKR